MNYLAHAYLSFGRSDLLAGNLISDFVKGKRKFEFTTGIQQGISLHRAIDHFTDAHPATRRAREYFRPAYRLYSGAFVDVVYDHFLALDPGHFPGETLLPFTENVYREMQAGLESFPAGFRQIFPYMKRDNWLYHYRYIQGVEKSFGGLVRRAAYLTDPVPAIRVFEENYEQLKACYQGFFPELYAYALGLAREYGL
jgi:acyl carrier protein phosphodiesterase